MYIPDWFPLPVLLREISDNLKSINKRLKKMQATIETLTARVAATETVGDSMMVLMRQLKSDLDAAGTDKVALAALSDRLGTKAVEWANAVAENTAAAEEPPVEEPPVEPVL